jgi:hypothetical protein
MRRKVFILFAAIVSWIAPAGANQQHFNGKSHLHHTRRRAKRLKSWDPGYTYSNPYGLPPWFGRPRR